MKKFLLLLILNTFLFTSISYALDENLKTKSELLKAMKRADTPAVKAISKRGSHYIKSDPVLQKMIEAYYEQEAKDLEVVKQEIKKMQEEEAEALRLEEENKRKLALQKAEEKRLAQERAARLALKRAEDKKRAEALALKRQHEAKKAKKLAVKKETTKQPTVAKVARPVKPVTAVTVKTAHAPLANTQRYYTKEQLAGHWRQVKNKKKISFEMFDNNRFIIKERAETGTLTLEGYYDQNNDNLLLDINKITYNVRSREAAVKRVYKLKNVSSNKLVLVDGKGNVVYTLER